jgi:hypothetical protein
MLLELLPVRYFSSNAVNIMVSFLNGFNGTSQTFLKTGVVDSMFGFLQLVRKYVCVCV